VQDLLWSEQRISGVKLGDDHSIAADLIVGADGQFHCSAAKLGSEQQSKAL